MGRISVGIEGDRSDVSKTLPHPQGGCKAGSFVITGDSFVITVERFDRDAVRHWAWGFAIWDCAQAMNSQPCGWWRAQRLVGVVFGVDGSFLQLFDGRTGERVTLRRTRCD